MQEWFEKFLLTFQCFLSSVSIAAIIIQADRSRCSLWRAKPQRFYSHFPNVQGESASKGRRTGGRWNVNNGVNTNMVSLNTSSVAEWVIYCAVCKIFYNFPLWHAAKGLWLLNVAEHLHSPVRREKCQSTVSKLHPIKKSQFRVRTRCLHAVWGERGGALSSVSEPPIFYSLPPGFQIC